MTRHPGCTIRELAQPDKLSTTLEDFVTEYVLPELSYDYAALEPHISARIMELHHSKHHAAYVTGANNALAQLAEAREKGDFANINRLSKDLAFHTGGHVNHSVFWNNLSRTGATSLKVSSPPPSTTPLVRSMPSARSSPQLPSACRVRAGASWPTSPSVATSSSSSSTTSRATLRWAPPRC